MYNIYIYKQLLSYIIQYLNAYKLYFFNHSSDEVKKLTDYSYKQTELQVKTTDYRQLANCAVNPIEARKYYDEIIQITIIIIIIIHSYIITFIYN